MYYFGQKAEQTYDSFNNCLFIIFSPDEKLVWFEQKKVGACEVKSNNNCLIKWLLFSLFFSVQSTVN